MKYRNKIIWLFVIALLLLTACQADIESTGNHLSNDGSCVHADSNGDEFCDSCGIDVTVVLDFYAVNDQHGVFCDSDTTHGVDETTTFLKNKLTDPSAYEILLSSGDMWQGSIESNSTRGALMTEWMNELGFACMTLGNHEYDWGSEYIAQNAQLAKFPFLGINVKDSNVTTPYCQPSVVVERGGVKIGIIGAIGDCLSSISGEFTDGLEFTVSNQLTALVKAEAQRLRQDEGCDFIVYSIHDGGLYSSSNLNGSLDKLTGDNGVVYYDVSLSDGYVDLVFEGHTHRGYVVRDKHGVFHLQTGGNNGAMGYAQVCYNLVSNSFEVKNPKLLPKSVIADEALQDDSIVSNLIGKYFPDGDPYLDSVGDNAKFRDPKQLRTLLATLYLEAGIKQWGSEYDIVLGGGFMSCRGNGLNPGEVTYDEIYRLFPFDNDIVLGKITGEKLLSKFINSKNDSYFCDFAPELASTVEKNKTYYIVTDTYSSTYAPNGITEVARMKGTYARDLLRAYIADGNYSNISPISIAEANQIGNALGDNQTTEEVYRISGAVKSVDNTTWGNLYIQDEQGNTLYIYGLYDASGTVRYDAMQIKPQAGDKLVLTGSITKYVNNAQPVVEIKSARLIEME